MAKEYVSAFRSGSASPKPQAEVAPRRFWKTVLPFGALHFAVMTAGAFVVEPFSGGCMFIIPAYFMVLAVAIPILRLQRFGAGMAVFLPYAVLGFFPTCTSSGISRAA